jgi:multidrug efflux pump subunit AcrB
MVTAEMILSPMGQLSTRVARLLSQLLLLLAVAVVVAVVVAASSLRPVMAFKWNRNRRRTVA